VAWRDWIRGTEIEPSIYAADFLRLGEQIETLLAAGARIFHVDVGDGRFIPPVTFGPVVVQAIEPVIHAQAGRIDCHLMIEDPAGQLEQLAAAGADSITFHYEAVDEPEAVIAAAREQGLAVGMALKPETALEPALALAPLLDLVLVMSIHPGFSGQELLPGAIDRIAQVRELLPDETLIGVDGGVKDDNIADVHAAGAELLVAASAIFYEDDIAAAYTGLARAVA
jgi:ribulose-phosphate 3-epimerase